MVRTIRVTDAKWGTEVVIPISNIRDVKEIPEGTPPWNDGGRAWVNLKGREEVSYTVTESHLEVMVRMEK